MVLEVIHIPRINDGPNDFEKLFKIWNQVKSCSVNVCFDFGQCSFLRPNAVAFLGGLARLIQSRRRSVVFDWDSLHNQAVMTNLSQNGFAGTFGHSSSGWDGKSIPYREDTQFNPDNFAEYLSENWLGREWVKVSEALKNAIIERVLELYVNAFEHSETKIGTFSCGQYFQTLNKLQLPLWISV